VITVYGHKGDGKTTVAFSLPGQIACLSFDKKAFPVKAMMFKADERLHIYDAIRYLDEGDQAKLLDSSVKSLDYVNYLLDKISENKPDWIVIDGTDVLTNICEMVMRARNNLTPFQGVEWTLWKERKVYLRQVHRKAMNSCKRGIVYTSYIDQAEIIKNGQVYNKTDRPKWMDIQLAETDVVLRVLSEEDLKSSRRRYFVSVESSKVPEFKTGARPEVTDTGLDKVFALGNVGVAPK
jgi:hypothetical protein